MGITREFIGWEQPILVRAVGYLLDRYATNSECDLSGVIVVVPGRRAGRRLLEILVDRTAGQYPDFVPPQIETAGTLPDLLFVNQQQYADTLICNLVWAEALKSTNQRQLRTVVPEVPQRDDTDAWLALADLIRGQHRELAAEGLDFEDVAIACRKANESSESRRWFTLRAVQVDYLHRMDQIRYWDRQTARLEAVKRDECETDRDIVLVATVDLNRGIRKMLEPISDRVTALIGAPKSYSEHFDEFGTLVAEAWADTKLDLRSEHVSVVDRPDDQAATAVDVVSAYDGRYRADEITVGVADDRLIPHLQRHFGECNVATRWFDGQHLDQTPPYRLFEQLAEFIDGLLPGATDARWWNFEAYAALVRHPDLFNWIEANFAAPSASDGKNSQPWLVQLDEYRANHLQPRPGFWINSNRNKTLSMLWTKIGDLVADFAPSDDRGALFPEIARLDEWVEPIRNFVKTVYKSRSFNPDDTADNVAAAAIRRFDEILYGFERIPESVLPDVNAAQAIRMMLSECVGEFVPPPRDDSAIELLGWLELVLDDSPALVVTTFNEQFVPQSSTSDMFLPNQLRKRLDLNDNTQRYARDAYAMHVMLRSRQELKLIVGRRDDTNDPLAPSRLLFATEPAEIPSRVLEFYPVRAEPNTSAERSRLFSDRETSGFKVPRPDGLEPPLDSLTVSYFKDYLRCPYRFYLQHVLKLREADDSAREMHPGQFGTIIHDVLEDFGRDTDIRDSLNPADICSFLTSALDNRVRRKFGKVRTAATNVQIQRIRLRLERFADWQANWASMGYRIRYAEDATEDNSADRVTFPIGEGDSVELRGRIDRIDQRGNSDEWVIFDYKTSDSAKRPDETHIKGQRNLGPDRWVDLQLPLYRHLARSLPTDCGQNYKVGYILLPGDVSKIGDEIAKWSADDLQEADDLARDVARHIVAKQFWPPKSVDYPSFARICQDAVFDREVLA